MIMSVKRQFRWGQIIYSPLRETSEDLHYCTYLLVTSLHSLLPNEQHMLCSWPGDLIKTNWLKPEIINTSISALANLLETFQSIKSSFMCAPQQIYPTPLPIHLHLFFSIFTCMLMQGVTEVLHDHLGAASRPIQAIQHPIYRYDVCCSKSYLHAEGQSLLVQACLFRGTRSLLCVKSLCVCVCERESVLQLTTSKFCFTSN